MNEIEIIPFADALEACARFVEHPDVPENESAMEELKKRTVIRGFLSMQEKMVTLYRILLDADKSYDLPVTSFTTALELAFFFDGLLAYTNISREIPKEAKIYEAYDVFYQSGFADFIIGYCRRDYDRLQAMLDRTFALGNLKDMMDTLKNIDSATMKESLDEFKEFQNTVDPRVMKDIADIVRYNDPLLYQVKEDIIDKAMEQLERIDELEKLENFNFADDEEE